MNKLIIGLLLGEGANQQFLQNFAKIHNFKYIKIGGIDTAHMATVNNLNQAEYWARVYAEAFNDVKNGQNVVLDMDYFSDQDISELCTLAKDNGVLHVQGALPKLKNNLDLLGGEKTVARVLQNEDIKVDGLDSLYVEDLNVEIIKNISSVSPKFIEKNNLQITTEKNKADFESSLNNLAENKTWKMAVDIAYGLLGIVLLGVIFWLGNSLYKKWQTPVETQVVYTGQTQKAEDSSKLQYVNTNQPIVIDDVSTPTLATVTEVIQEVVIATNTSSTPTSEMIPVAVNTVLEEKQVIVKPQPVSTKKYGKINPEIVTVPYCCTDGTFRSWYNYRGEMGNIGIPTGEVFYVKTNDYVYIITNTQIDSSGRAVGGDAYLVTNANVTDFNLLNDYMKNHNFGRDSQFVYYKGKILKGMDPNFTMLYCPSGTLQSCYFNDGYYSYSMMTGNQIDYAPIKSRNY